MNRKHRIEAFSALGSELNRYLQTEDSYFRTKIDAAVLRAFEKNTWFEEVFVKMMLQEIAHWLKKSTLEQWQARYSADGRFEKKIALVAAGNVPMVGFHDALCILISGNKLLFKPASDDPVLIPCLLEILEELEPAFCEHIEVRENLREQSFDAVIATGSNNSSRYFDYYFSKYPNLIRKNRNSAAVLSGKESKEALHALGADIFNYFGLGCRSVSKLFVPENYRFDTFYESIFDYQWVLNNNRYNDNYSYNRTIYLMNSDVFLDNGFLLLKEDVAMSSPVGVLFWERYADAKDLENKLKREEASLQCCLGADKTPFGRSQYPALDDYADGIDTMLFLSKILTSEAL